MGDVRIQTADGAMEVFVAEPDETPSRGVIVIEEAFGVNDHIQDVAERVAAAGYLALAPHLFHRTGDPIIPYGEIDSAMEHVRALTGAGLLTDLDACLAYLEERGIAASRTGTVGFCMGGTVSFFAAAMRPIGASVTFYGGGIDSVRWEGVPALLDIVADLRCPWLGLYGEQDKGIPVHEVDELQEMLVKADVPTEIVRYPDAGHGFHCDARPAAYHEPSARDGWARTLDWFRANL